MARDEIPAGRLILEIVTPEALILSEEVDEVIAEGVEGDFGVLPGHISFLTALRPGHLTYRVGDRTERVPIAGGVAEVVHDRVTILASTG